MFSVALVQNKLVNETNNKKIESNGMIKWQFQFQLTIFLVTYQSMDRMKCKIDFISLFMCR